MADCRFLLCNKHWVWDRTIHEEMKSQRRKGISPEEGIKDEKRQRPLLDNCA